MRDISVIEAISPVFAESVGCLTADRDARIVPAPDGDDGFAVVEMDDDGYGHYVTSRLADALVTEGFARDAR